MSANPLRARILDAIRREGAIPFSRYMSMCLYQPELGYYMRPREQFGKEGDFYTSSDVHALFGRLLCRQFVEFWQALGAPGVLDLIELGPGRGLFAVEFGVEAHQRMLVARQLAAHQIEMGGIGWHSLQFRVSRFKLRRSSYSYQRSG